MITKVNRSPLPTECWQKVIINQPEFFQQKNDTVSKQNSKLKKCGEVK